MQRSKLGPVYIFIAAVLWSLGGLGTKFIPWHPLSIAAVRGTSAVSILLFMKRGEKIRFTRSTVLTALCMFLTTVLFMFSNKMTTAANAIVLQYLAPVYVLIGVMIVQKKRPKGLDILTIGLTFIGILLFFVDHMGSGKLLGDSLSILSGLTFAGVFFLSDMPDANPHDASVIGCGLSILLLPVLFFDPVVRTSGAIPWVTVIALGVVQLGMGYYFFGKGIVSTGPIPAAIISIVEPILNPIWVFLFLDERPGTLSILGACIVMITISFYNIFPQVAARKKAN